MKTFREWVDFAVYPLNPERVKTLEDRLDVSGSTTDSDQLSRMETSEAKFRVTKEIILFDDDGAQFEAMAIDDYGKIHIWTTKRVWFLQRFGGLEKLQYVIRNPI